MSPPVFFDDVPSRSEAYLPNSPLLLQAQISPPAGGGSFGLADSTRLENPFQAPMWLDEIRFSIVNAEAGAGIPPWSRTKVELTLGNLSLTNGFVPIALFGKVLSDASIVAPFSTRMFTWKLPKPLFIPAREFLRVTLYYETYSGAPVQPINIMYACRPLPKGTPTPKILQVPWVTYFKPPDITAVGSTDTTNQSSPSDLYNPFDQELHVQRFVGRFMPQATMPELDGNMGLASALVNLSTGAIIVGTLVSAQDSFNNILIRDRTPFAHVFDSLDRAWTVNCVLPPKGFYLFTVDRLWSGYTGTAITATVGISMVGWREVSFYP